MIELLVCSRIFRLEGLGCRPGELKDIFCDESCYEWFVDLSRTSFVWSQDHWSIAPTEMCQSIFRPQTQTETVYQYISMVQFRQPLTCCGFPCFRRTSKQKRMMQFWRHNPWGDHLHQLKNDWCLKRLLEPHVLNLSYVFPWPFAIAQGSSLLRCWCVLIFT